MTKSATAASPLSLVPASAHPLTAAERAKASAAAAKDDASEALEGLKTMIAAAIKEARDLSTVDTFSESIRAEMNKFATNSTGSLDLLTRSPR